MLRAQLKVGAAGTVRTHTGDGTWKAAAGPVTADSVYNGEDYDATITMAMALADDGVGSPTATWVAAPVLAASASPAGVMVPWSAPPIGITDTVKPVSVVQSKTAPEIYVVDFGVNLAGVVNLKAFPCARGSVLTFRHAEIMQHAGLPDLKGHVDPTKVYMGNLRSAKATDHYTCSGAAGGETWHPRFTYHGFRFVEVNVTAANVRGAGGAGGDTSSPPPFTADNIEMLHFHSLVNQRTTAKFKSATLNKIQTMALGAQRSNMMSVPTDCDQRDERLGWMGDANLSGDSIGLNFDALSFLSFYMDTIASEVGADGSLTDVVPFVRFGGRPGDVSWTAAYANLAHVAWTILGDTRLAKEHLATMILQAANVKAQAAQGLANMHTPYGDWCPPPAKMGGGQGPKPAKPYTSAFSYLAMLRQVADMATATGNATAGAALAAEAKAVAVAFTAAFESKGSSPAGCFDSCATQTGQVLALELGVATDVNATRGRLLELIQNASAPNHYSTGIIGFKFLFDQLKAAGHEETALSLLSQTDYPSIGFYFANAMEPASTNLWELPDAVNEGVGMNSRNHHMWSSYSAYLVRSVAGVDQRGGGAEFLLRPASVTGLAGAEVEMNTPLGAVSMKWTNRGGTQMERVAGGVGDAAQIKCGGAGHGGVIAKVAFASFGAPAVRAVSDLSANAAGAAQNSRSLDHLLEFGADDVCHAPSSLEVVASRCEGREQCDVAADASLFADLPAQCHADLAQPSRLWIQAVCSEPLSVEVEVTVPVAAGKTTTLELPLYRVAAAAASNSATQEAMLVEVLEGGQRVALVDVAAMKEV